MEPRYANVSLVPPRFVEGENFYRRMMHATFFFFSHALPLPLFSFLLRFPLPFVSLFCYGKYT